MKAIGTLYDYLFFTIYRFWEIVPSRWWSDWKTLLTICYLYVILLSSIYCFVIYLSRIELFVDSILLPIIFSAIITGFNYYYFLHKDKWKEKILRFETLDRKKDITGIISVVLIVLLLFSALIYSFYLLSTVGWQSQNTTIISN